MTRKIEIIGAPFNYGGSINGSQYAVSSIRDAGILDSFIRNLVVDTGDVIIENSVPSYAVESNIKNINKVLQCNVGINQRVKDSLLRNNIPLIIGGDHSISWGSISAVSSVYKDDFLVCYIDAHADINTSESSLTHNAHGMHLSYLMGLGGEDSLNNFFGCERKISKTQLLYVGARSLDNGEVSIIKKNNLKIIEINKNTGDYKTIIDWNLKEWIEKASTLNIHISLDIDCLDPEESPGTGVPENNGMTIDQLSYILSKLVAIFNVISIDLVEFNPELDLSNKSLNCCRKIMKIFDKI